MDAGQFARVCDLYNLGTVITVPQSTSGGMMNHVWHIETTRGQFAVKELNPSELRRPDMREIFRQTEQVALRMAVAGIPAMGARPSAQNGDEVLADVGDATVMVYDWIDGTTLTADTITPAQAFLMGGVVGRMHNLRLNVPDLRRPSRYHFDNWDSLLERAEAQQLTWASSMRAEMPMLREITRTYEDSVERVNRDLLVSHRDLDIRNVLWRDLESPVLIDWEDAGLINPARELVGLALFWSGGTSPTPREAVFSAIASGYHVARPEPVSAQMQTDGLIGIVASVTNWMLFNMRRSVGEIAVDPEERALRTRLTGSLLADLHTHWSNFDRWKRWLAAYL